MKVIKSSIPQVEGFYFAKYKESKVWQIIVHVCGFAPFLYIESVNTLFKESDSNILSDFREADWSEVIEVFAVADHWRGYDITHEAKKEAIELIKEGSKLAAVKLIKFSTKDPNDDEADCLGLKDAKEYVDMLQDQIKEELNRAAYVAS